MELNLWEEVISKNLDSIEYHSAKTRIKNIFLNTQESYKHNSEKERIRIAIIKVFTLNKNTKEEDVRLFISSFLGIRNLGMGSFSEVVKILLTSNKVSKEHKDLIFNSCYKRRDGDLYKDKANKPLVKVLKNYAGVE